MKMLVYPCCLILSIFCSEVVSGAAPPDGDGAEQNLRLFRQVWETVRDEFFDPQFAGLDWEAVRQRYEEQVRHTQTLEQAAVPINLMLAELKTSHTHFYTQWDTEYYQLADIFQAGSLGDQIRKRFESGVVSYTGIGLRAVEIDGGTVVKSVFEGGPAAKAGLKVGQRIIAVEGRQYHAIKSFVGKAGQPVRITLQYAESAQAIKTIEIVPVEIKPNDMFLQAMKDSLRLIERNGRKIGYVHVWSYAGEQYHELLKQEIAFGRLTQADALIVDLRDGWGGANPSYLSIFDRNVPRLLQIHRDGRRRAFDSQWRKPAALLINGGTRSGKEVIAFGFKKAGYGKLIGTRTAGAVTAGRLFLVGDQALLYLAVADVRVDGQRLEGRGVAPDIDIPFPLLYAGEPDPQLEAAVAELAK